MSDARRHQYWRAAVVGLAAGVAALVFQWSLEVFEGGRESLLEYLHEYYPATGWMLLIPLVGIIGAVIGYFTTRIAPEAAGSGIPHVKGVLMHVGDLSWARVLPVKYFGGLFSIGAGFSLGREGPTIQMGAAVGKLVSDVLRIPPKAKPRLMACGAGAGLAAAFHAPLAGFIFTVEELQREFSTTTYGMALIAAVLADIVTTSVSGTGNAFHASGFPAPEMSSFPVYVAIGLIAAVFGAAFNKMLLGCTAYCKEMPSFPPWKRAGVAGFIVGAAVWWMPEITGGGHHSVEAILHGDIAGGGSTMFLLILFAGKFLLTIVCYAAGVPGGIFAPMLLMGASLGLVSGIAANALFASIAPIPESFAAIGMAAFFAAVVRSPLTGIVLVLEMTGDYQQLLPLLTASMVAYVFSESMGIEPIYEALLAIDLRRANPDIPSHREPILLEFVVQEESEMDGKRIREIPIPERCLFVTIARHGNDMLPSGETELQRGDRVTAVISGANAPESVNRLLSLSKV
ncbi:MAG: H(+)/Cl(-) exchange transporter ClcA [Candidatus Hydrogenedens sp.]|nr:H(+)/Cl(-) exchange transporter ClcA [Candidatus Hydrogenedens sp.]